MFPIQLRFAKLVLYYIFVFYLIHRLYLKNYDIGQLVGKGGFACVYRGRVRATGKSVAIKVMDKRKIGDERVAQRVTNEIQIHWQLQHSSIAELYVNSVSCCRFL